MPFRFAVLHVRKEPALTGTLPRGVFLRRGTAALTTVTEQEIQRNMRAVAHAIGQQELEGLTVSDATVADLHRAARGEIDTNEVIRNIHSRIPNVPLLR
jgi:hypothetical protein